MVTKFRLTAPIKLIVTGAEVAGVFNDFHVAIAKAESVTGAVRDYNYIMHVK